jgi:hypothetical protein
MTGWKRTLAEYDPSTNPWHEWLQDNVPADLHEWIRQTEMTTRLVETGQWDARFQVQRLTEWADERGLDRRRAGEAWADYETFKAMLAEYRLAKYRN